MPPVQTSPSTASSVSILVLYWSESSASTCGARPISSSRALPSSFGSTELSEYPSAFNGATNTSPGESTTTIFPEYFGATSKNCFQVLTSSLTSFVRTAMPVVPQSLGSWYSLFGSHHRPLNGASMYCAFGILDQLIFWMKPCSTIAGTNSAVGAAMSYWPLAPPWSLVIISSFEAYVSYVNLSTLNWVWNCFMLSGST